jgi:hypothetical protein
LAQLAEMGVSIPDEFRGEMAMAGEWQVTSERIIDPTEGKEKKPEAIGFGVRKRTVPDDEEEAEAAETKKRRWGSTYRTHPGGDDDADLDALLNMSAAKGKQARADSDVNQELPEGASNESKPLLKVEAEFREDHKLSITRESSDGQVKLTDTLPALADVDIKNDSGSGNVVFKKRKAKNAHQK